ncbi:MAG: response regulator transcription factor [Gammaproteobacteria bacterium]|nr:response regulator transcription factor [Gammaproteobacteria bacterium]MDH5727899.1 response regulator transcription factor [Gammaproteobacteria bacterium]
MRILVIEDESTLRLQLVEQLSQHGYAVDAAENAKEGQFLGCEHAYDAAIVDLGLPDYSGLQVIQHWRNEQVRFPVLILTARGRWQEKVEGLEAGADDYMVKPFHVEELQARLRALIRRAAGNPQTDIQCGPIRLNPRTQKVFVGTSEIELTAYEFKFLEYLILHQGEVISKTKLIEHIYDQDFDRDSNVIEVFVRRIRKKLDPNNQLNPIETLRGRGYRLVCMDNIE